MNGVYLTRVYPLYFKERCDVMTITEPLNLDQVKAFLRVEHNLDDDYISSLITVAREYVETYQGRLIAERVAEDESEEVPEYEIPKSYELQAMLLLISHYYDNRQAITAQNMSEIPYTITRLLYFNRDLTGII